MSLRDYDSKLITDFGGAVLLLDAPDVKPGDALLARNVEFVEGRVKVRNGFGDALNLNEACTLLHNWPDSPQGNIVVWYRTSDNAIRWSKQSAFTNGLMIGPSFGSYSAIIAIAGTRMLAAPIATTQRSTGAGGVGSYVVASVAFASDFAFNGPVTFGGSGITEPSAGVVTAGAHRFGFAIEYRSGFRTRLSPDNSGSGAVSTKTFVPYTFSAAGSKNIQWVITPATTWPADAVAVWPAMTTVNNLSRLYFIPGGRTAVTGGGAGAATCTINISDDDLAVQGAADEATPNINFWTRNTNGDHPLQPYWVGMHGDRAVWLFMLADGLGNTRSAAAISNVGAYQEITQDQHLQQIPGGRDINCCMSQGGVLYLLGPSWTYQTIDNGDVPAGWPTPQVVDGRRGTPSIRGVEVAPGGQYGWVADQAGLFLFSQGQYANLPVSYRQSPDWDRINWGAAHVLQVKDNPGIRKVYVLAALDGATSPTHLLSWDYTNGMGYKDARYSLDDISGYSTGAIAMVINGLASMPNGVANKLEPWLAPSNASYAIRRLSDVDTTPKRDRSMPIDAQYETSPLPPKSAGVQLAQHYATNLRLKGSGNPQLTVYTLDRAKLKSLSLVTSLNTAPGREFLKTFNLLGESTSCRILTNEVFDPSFEDRLFYQSDTVNGVWTAPLSGWTRGSTSGQARTGTYYATHVGASTGIQVLANAGVYAQVVTAGETMNLLFWTKGASAPDGTFTAYIFWYDAAGAQISSSNVGVSNTGSYTLNTLTAAAPANAATYSVQFWVTSKTVGTWYLDDVFCAKRDAYWELSSYRHYFKDKGRR